MPHYFGEGDPGWEKLDDDVSPKASDFHYLRPPDIGGSRDPVPFSLEPPAPRPAKPTPTTPRPSFWDRLLGRRMALGTPREEREAEHKHRTLHAIALVGAALSEAGAKHVYCRYDGGNDEGFAWLDHVATHTGEKLSGKDIAARLTGRGLASRMAAAGLLYAPPDDADVAFLQSLVADGFAIDCALLLLGSGFGTGPFYLYGAFTVDLEACTITDDRNADLVVGNIAIER